MPDRITINDVRQAGHCVKGVREWFERHDLDFRAFLKAGIDVDTLLKTGDHLAADVVKRKRERAGG